MTDSEYWQRIRDHCRTNDAALICEFFRDYPDTDSAQSWADDFEFGLLSAEEAAEEMDGKDKYLSEFMITHDDKMLFREWSAGADGGNEDDE